MMVEQWSMRVPVKRGEEIRRALIEEGVFDLSLKVQRVGSTLVLPLTGPREGAEIFNFETQPERQTLPRHELVGGIAVMLDRDPAGAANILTTRPSIHTVVYAASEVSGEYRTREFEILAGTPTTRTEVIEYGHRFTVDLTEAYFSARLSTERQRINNQVHKNETILDMFAGVGPFAITLAKKAAFIVASDINPQAIMLMLENISLNRVKNIIPMLADAHRVPAVLPWKFDRIVMNLPLAGKEFLPEAFRMCKTGGKIHFYTLVSARGEHTARIQDLGGIVLDEREVRSYSPGQWHTVYDIEVRGDRP